MNVFKTPYGKTAQKIFLLMICALSMSPEFGYAKENNKNGGVSLKKINLTVSDSIYSGVEISFTYPIAMPNPTALVELQKNFIKQAFGDKYVGLKPPDVVKRVAKDIAKNARPESGNEHLCWEDYKYGDTVSFPISGFVNYSTDYYDYTCGAHGSYHFKSCLYNLADGKKVEPKDIFVKGWERSVTKLIINEYSGNSLDNGYAKEKDFIPTSDMLSFEDPEGITFVYNHYQIGPYIDGNLNDILVSWDDLKPYLNKNSAIYPKLKLK